MGTNTTAPTGLVYARNRFSGSPTFQTSIYQIKNGTTGKIGIGDLVITDSVNTGYVALSTGVEIAQLGVFVGITSPPPGSNTGVFGAQGDGVYDTNLQALNYGLNGAYVSTISPPAGIDIGAKVIDDPGAVFRVQMVNGAWATSLRGKNINFTAATNGAPNASGLSVLSVDFNTVGVGNQLPFRIIGLSGFVGGPQDPSNTNPWIEVALNTAEMLQGAGI